MYSFKPVLAFRSARPLYGFLASVMETALEVWRNMEEKGILAEESTVTVTS